MPPDTVAEPETKAVALLSTKVPAETVVMPVKEELVQDKVVVPEPI